jgi:hypothetical protein
MAINISSKGKKIVVTGGAGSASAVPAQRPKSAMDQRAAAITPFS